MRASPWWCRQSSVMLATIASASTPCERSAGTRSMPTESTCGLPAMSFGAPRVAAVEQRPLAVAQHRDLRAAVSAAVLVEHAKHRPVRAGIGHLRHVAPGQRNAVAAIHRAQVAGRIRIEEMPVRIGRDLRHAAHDHRRRELDLLAGLDAIATRARGSAGTAPSGTSSAPAKKLHSKSRQACSTSCAFMPRGDARAAFGAAAHLAAGGVRGLQAVALVQHLVREVRGEIELQPRRVGLQRAVEIDRCAATRRTSAPCCAASRSLSRASTGLRSNQRIVRPCRLHSRSRSSTSSGKRRSPTLSAARSRSGKVVARHFLVRADQEVRELPARSCRSARAAQESPPAAAPSRTGTRARAARAAAPPARCARASALDVARCHRGTSSARAGTATTAAPSTSSEGTRLPLSIMLRYETEGALCAVELDAARRELFQREAVALAQRAQLGAEEVALAGVQAHAIGQFV